MTIADLIAKLQQCDPLARAETSTGANITQVVRHSGMQRVALCDEDEESSEETLALGWEIL